MGGAMLRDFTIVATAFEVQATEAKSWIYWCLLFISRTILPFIVGCMFAWILAIAML